VTAPDVSAASVPDPALTAEIVHGTRLAVQQLHDEHPGPFCVYALATSGEALRPYLIVTPDDATRWDLPDSPFAVYGDEHLAGLEELFTARGDLFDMSAEQAQAEYDLRLASMEAALRALDADGLFAAGDALATPVARRAHARAQPRDKLSAKHSEDRLAVSRPGPRALPPSRPRVTRTEH